MGLELIEYFLAIENAFEQDIPLDELVKLETPLLLIDYLCARLGETSDGAQLTQVAFYRLRAALAEEFAVSRRDIRPTSSVVELAPHRDETEVWVAVARRIGVGVPRSTSVQIAPWLRRRLHFESRSVGVAAELLALMHPLRLRDSERPGTRAQITDLVRRALARELGIEISEREPAMPFVRDLGMGKNPLCRRWNAFARRTD
jgi:acyl carrier protein